MTLQTKLGKKKKKKKCWVKSRSNHRLLLEMHMVTDKDQVKAGTFKTHVNDRHDREKIPSCPFQVSLLSILYNEKKSNAIFLDLIVLAV